MCDQVMWRRDLNASGRRRASAAALLAPADLRRADHNSYHPNIVLHKAVIPLDCNIHIKNTINRTNGP